MKEIDATRLKLKAMELVEGTDLKWGAVIRHKPSKQVLAAHSCYLDDVELALGIVESNPVWEGDEYYDHNGYRAVALAELPRTKEYWSNCSWLPPKQKTVMVELPLKVVEIYARAGECTLKDACHKALEQLK